MATIEIDGKKYEAEAGKNLLHVALSEGLDLPYFCWHPALGSVGACRQCAVKQYRDENDTQGRLVMACMTPVTEGMRITAQDPDSKNFRATVIESLMTNHPHDCPICDEGGECHLQDMTVMSGHNYREYRFKKRTFNNQDLGPFINHEMNRCITCYRCVRFYRDYAGGRDLDAFASKNHVYFGRFEDGVLENEFSGNLVEVCPTGVFTDKVLKEHYTRKWDLQTAPSICAHCGVGCNTIPGERYGQIRRVLNRYNGEVNGYFLCDRGRFGHAFVNSPKRLRTPMSRSNPIAKQEALASIATIIKNSKGVVGIGSPRATLEANFALRTLVGEDRFHNGLGARENHLTQLALEILRTGPARSASLKDAEESDAVLVLGEDVTNTAPLLALRLRQSVRNLPREVAAKVHIPEWHDLAVRESAQETKGPLFVVSMRSTRLDDIAIATYRLSPADIARFGFAVAHTIHPEAPSPLDLDPRFQEAVTQIAAALKGANNPLVVSGTGSGNEAVLGAAANVSRALHAVGVPAKISLNVPECNTLGVAMMEKKGLDAALARVQSGHADTVVVLENDLYRRGSAKEIDSLFAAAAHVISIDHLENSTAVKAEIVIPCGTFAESDGTMVNSEGRAQGFFQVFVPEEPIEESWRWIRDILNETGDAKAEAWNNLDDVLDCLAEEIPSLSPAREAVVSADFRIAGMKIPRQPHRYSGRTAMRANISVHEPKPPEDMDSPMAYTMEGFQGMPPSAIAPRYWAPGWNSVQSLNKFQEEVGGPMRGGDSGKRLFEPTGEESIGYFSDIPAASHPTAGEFLVVPVHHIFGSDELSVHTQGIEERRPRPYLAVNPEDAAQSGVVEGVEIAIPFGVDGTVNLTVALDETLPQGVAGIPIGLPDLPQAFSAPEFVKIPQGVKK